MKGISRNVKRTVALLLAVLMLMNLSVFVSAATPKLAANMYWTTDIQSGEWTDAGTGAIFDVSDFAPGSETVRYLKVENAGKRALSYSVAFTSETEAGELADVIDVYYMKDAEANSTVADMTRIGTLADVINGTQISAGNILPSFINDDGFYTGNAVFAVALKMQENAPIDYINKSVADFSVKLTATQYTDYTNYPTEDKFELAFPNTDKYIYRVGNANAIKLSSLFKALEGADIGNVTATIEKIDGATDVAWTYTPNATWTNSTIQFTGTGTVKVTIADDDYSNALSVNLEVINAVNATSAASATKNNVVLLNDVSLHTIEVSGGYTLYGNGFKMTAANDVMYDTMGVGFVTLNNGTLDNVQIICPNFSYSIMFKGQITSEDNTARPENYESNDARGNVRSAVMADGNSTISNSYIHGGRAAIYLRSGNLLVDNSTVSGGATANIHTTSAQKLTLRDATMIQKPLAATVHDTTKTVMGLSGLFESTTALVLEGTLRQYAWADESHGKYVPSVGKDIDIDIVSLALKQDDYLHDLDRDGTNESVNLGFVYMPADILSELVIDNTVDNRTDKDQIPYEYVKISAAQVYSYKNTNGTAAEMFPDENYQYAPTKQGAATPVISFDGTRGVFETKFDTSDNRWESALTVNLDEGNYDFNFSDIKATKNGKELDYTVTENGASVDKSKAIALTESGVRTFTLTVEDDENYGANGEKGETVYHTFTFVLTATKTSIPEPEIVDTTGGTPLLVVASKGGDWSCAIPALEGIKVKYYTSASNAVTLDLATLTPESTGKQNGTNNYWEYSDGYSLKVTCGVIHDGKQVYGMPVVVNNGGNKMYFVISSDSGLVSTSTSSRTVTVTYEFTDPNGKTLTFDKTWQFNYADYKSGKQYSYSSFVNGTLKEASGGCVTGDTLVTLADGSAKRIDEVTYADKLLVWNFFDGKYEAVSPAVIFDHGYSDSEIIKLTFEDGTEIKVVDTHQFFDVEANEFVTVSADNAEALVGREFVKADGNGYKTVKLSSCEISEENTKSYGIISSLHYNILVEGMLTTDLQPQDCGLHYYFEVGENMTYDKAKMEADIEQYGLYTYDDFAEYLTEEFFDAYNVKYMKVAVGKGQYTYQGILDLIQKWLVDSDDVVPMQNDEYAIAVMSDEEPTVTIVSTGNKITSATYAITATEMDTEGNVTLTAEGTAPTGYATIKIDGDTYYTAQLAPSETISVKFVNLQNAKDTTLTMTYDWGTSAVDSVAQDALLANGAVIDFGVFAIKSINGAVVTLSNTTKYPVTGDVYLAVYNGDVFVGAEKNGNITVDGKDDDYTVELKAALPENATVEAFVWEVGTMCPILR